VATASDAITSDVSDTELAHAIEAASRAVHKRPDLALPPLRPVVQPEVTADKVLARMQRRRWPILIALSLFLILVSGTITYIVLYNQAMQRETNRTSGYRLLDEAIALVQEGDLEVIALDEAIKTEITAEDLARRRVILEKVPTTTKTLTSALEAAQAAQPLLTSSEDQAFARHVLDAAANRLDMLSSGAVLLDNDIKAMNCAQLFGLAWDLLVRADEDMRSATKTAQSGNYYDVRAAIDLNTTVLEVLNQASELLGQAQAAFEAADFSAVSSYLILKKESVELAISSDQALLDANLDAAYTHNSAFAQKDAEVVAAAARIPADPLSLIISTYDRVISADKQLFDSARANVADADVFIREYLGVETQTGVQ
jgi:hypothetical protein